MRKLKTAILGCGAVAKSHHLPVIAASPRAEVTVLVDKFLPRARQLADTFGVPSVTDNYQEIIGKVDAAVVALPNCLHGPVTVELLRAGIHVLVEKPMALTASECDDMIEAAGVAERVLAVGLEYRFFHSSQFLRTLFKDRLLGDINEFHVDVGIISKWPSASDFLYRKEAAGGGVLIDWGVHVLDLLLWWLGDYDRVEYYDDAAGGVESDCELHLKLQCGASGTVQLCRSRSLPNLCRIQGQRGILDFSIWDPDPTVRLNLNRQDLVLSGRVVGHDADRQTIRNVISRQFDNFVEAIVNHRDPLISGQEGKRTVSLIEACYASRRPLQYPWGVQISRFLPEWSKQT
jgi:predicted dehydrogenase